MSGDETRLGRIAGFHKVVELIKARYVDLQNRLYFVAGALYCTSVTRRAVIGGREFLKKRAEEETISPEELKIRLEMIDTLDNLITKIGVQYSDEQQSLVGEGRLMCAQVDDMSKLCQAAVREHSAAHAIGRSVEDARQYCFTHKDEKGEVMEVDQSTAQPEKVEKSKKRKKKTRKVSVEKKSDGTNGETKVKRRKRTKKVSESSEAN